MPGPVANVKATHENRMKRIEELSKMSEYARDDVNETDLDDAISRLSFGSPNIVSPASPGFILAMTKIRSDALAKAAKIKSEALAKAAKATAAKESARIDRELNAAVERAAKESARIDRELNAAVERARIEREKPSMLSYPDDRAAAIKQARAAFAKKSAATTEKNAKIGARIEQVTDSAVARFQALAQNAKLLKNNLSVKKGGKRHRSQKKPRRRQTRKVK